MASSKSRKRRKTRSAAPKPLAEPGAGAAPVAKPAPKRAGLGATIDDRPPAPWGSFPLVELCVLAGLVMLVIGFFFVEGDRAPAFVIVGLMLASLGGFELAIREHFAGYRSHSALLAGLPAALVLGGLYFLGPDDLPQIARLAIAVAVFAAFAVLLVRVFRARSGGYSVRLPQHRRR